VSLESGLGVAQADSMKRQAYKKINGVVLEHKKLLLYVRKKIN
jgi:hypothetical protein